MSYFRNNVKEYLKVFDDFKKIKIINQIFGYYIVDGIYNEGMVDVDLFEMFDFLYEFV